MSLELVLFYTASVVAVASTVMVITRLNAAHALLYLVVSLLAVAVLFYLLGAPFAAGLEVIIYAGAIMVLFVFVIMMLNMGHQTINQERDWLHPRMWIGPGILCAVLLFEVLLVLNQNERPGVREVVSAKEVGVLLYGPYLLAVELASKLLLAGLVGAYHIGRSLKRNANLPPAESEEGA